MEWAAGYASGDPAKRYESKWAFHIWSGFMTQVATTGATALHVLGAF